jgi:hypothetical protein
MQMKQLTISLLAVSLSISPAFAAPISGTDLAAKPLFKPEFNPATQYDNLLFPASADNKYGF